MARRDQKHIDETAALKKQHSSEMENQRSQYELQINELEAILRKN